MNGSAADQVDPALTQVGRVVRTEWGSFGARALADAAHARGAHVLAVVVDVLSFTTSVSVALDEGAVVFPYRWGTREADGFACDHAATLAVGRSQVPDRGPVSLSPASLRDGLRANRIQRLVLPSPNGSTIADELAGSGATVLAGCLRNASAVAGFIATRMRTHAGRGEPVAVVVVPAGERWPDGSLRPAIEDLWGAGAVLCALTGLLEHQAGPTFLSPESALATRAFEDAATDLHRLLAECVSGIELAVKGYEQDVAIAAELDSTHLVPVLGANGAFDAA